MILLVAVVVGLLFAAALLSRRPIPQVETQTLDRLEVTSDRR